MPITYVNGNAAENGGGSGGISVAKPTGLQNGDVLFASAIVSSSGSTIMGLPSGFTLYDQQNYYSTAGVTSVVGYKAITNAASEPATYDFSFSVADKGAASIVAYRGLNPDNPIANAGSWWSSANDPASFTPSYIAHPYRPHHFLLFFFGGAGGSATWTSSIPATYPVTELIDVTSSGGGPGTGKVNLSVAEAPNPLEGTPSGVISAYVGYYGVDHSSGEATTLPLLLNAADSAAIGEATTFDTTASLQETLVAPLQFTFDKQVAYTRHQMTIWGAPRHTPIPGLNTLDTIYEVGPGRFISLYAEYDDRWANNATYGREQEGKAISFQSYDNYTRFGEPDADYSWGSQSATTGSGGIDSTRFSDDIFVTYSGNGHTYGDSPGGGTYNYFLGYGPRSSIIKYDSNTNTFTKLGTVVPFSSSDKLNYLGSVVRTGPTTITYTGAKRRDDGTNDLSEYGAKVVHIDPNTNVITQGTTVYFHPENSGTHYYQSQVAHVDDSRILFFYYNNTTNNYVTRVGDISNDINGKPVVLTFSATINNTPNTSTSASTFPAMKPVALSATEGFYLHLPSTNTRTLVLQRYTLNPDDTVTFGSQMLIKDSSSTGSIEGYSVEKVGALYVIATSYRPNTASNNSSVDVTYLDWDSGTETLTNVSSETVLNNTSAPYRAVQVVPGHSAPTYHIKYVFSSDISRPFFSTFSTPVNTTETDDTNDLSAYVHVAEPNPFNHTQPAMCFIQTEGVYATGQKAYIGAPASPVPNIPKVDAFVVSAGAQTSSVLAYIVETPNASASQTAFIHAGAETSPGVTAYVSGPDFIDNTPPQPAYIWGVGPHPNMPAMSCFIDGLKVLGRINPVGAIHLDRSAQQYIEFNDVDGIRPTGEFTMNFWMQAYDVPDTSYPLFIGKDYGTSRSIGIFDSGSATYKWHYGIDTSSGWGAQNSVASWVPETWYMVTLKYTGTEVRFYIDGVFDSSFAKTGDIRWDAGAWYVGYRPNTGEYVTMTFAEFGLWNYALSDTEIESLFSYKLEWGVGGYIEGGTFEVAQGQLKNHIVSDLTTTNPLDTSKSLSVGWAFDGVVDSHPCHIVGGQVSKVKHDLEIVVDQFMKHKHDLVLRTNGQGEGILTQFLGEIDYPVSRKATAYMTGVFFQDMPGKGSETLSCYMHSGFTSEESVSAHIVGPQMVYATTNNCFINAFVQYVQPSVSCFIPNDWGYVSQSAHINSNDIVNLSPPPTYCHISYVADTTTREITAYTSGWDSNSPEGQNAYIPTQEISQGFVHIHIHTPDVGNQTPTRQNAFIVSSVLAYSTPFNLFMFGVEVAEPSTQCFLHAFRAARPTVNCFINVGLPAIPDRNQDVFIYGNQPHDVSVSAHIQADTNAVPTEDAKIYIRGLAYRESSRYAHITNTVLFAAKGQRAYMSAPTDLSVIQKCFVVNSGLGPFSSVDAVLVYSGAPIPKSKTKRCFIVGEGQVVDALAYVFGTNQTTGDEGNDLFIYIEGEL